MYMYVRHVGVANCVSLWYSCSLNEHQVQLLLPVAVSTRVSGRLVRPRLINNVAIIPYDRSRGCVLVLLQCRRRRVNCRPTPTSCASCATPTSRTRTSPSAARRRRCRRSARRTTRGTTRASRSPTASTPTSARCSTRSSRRLLTSPTTRKCM